MGYDKVIVLTHSIIKCDKCDTIYRVESGIQCPDCKNNSGELVWKLDMSAYGSNQEYAEEIVDEWRRRADSGELPPAIEMMLWHYAYGKPVEMIANALDQVTKKESNE